jgi:hypothetical protein
MKLLFIFIASSLTLSLIVRAEPTRVRHPSTDDIAKVFDITAWSFTPTSKGKANEVSVKIEHVKFGVEEVATLLFNTNFQWDGRSNVDILLAKETGVFVVSVGSLSARDKLKQPLDFRGAYWTLDGMQERKGGILLLAKYRGQHAGPSAELDECIRVTIAPMYTPEHLSQPGRRGQTLIPNGMNRSDR